MKKWGRWAFVFLLLAACESKKTGNAFLFILSFDPLDYISANSSDFGSGLNLDTGDLITTATDGTSTITTTTIVATSGTGFLQSDASNMISSADSLDTESYIDLNDNTRQAFISVASQNINSCAGTGVLSAVTCSLGGFAIDIGSLLSAASDVVSLQINGISRDDDTIGSNTLTGKKYILRKVFSDASGITDAQSFVVHDEKLYFNARVSGSSYVMSYDGAALSHVVDLDGGLADDSYPLKSFDDQLLIQANDVTGYQLHSLSGTSLEKIIDLNSGNGDTIGDSVEFGGDLYITLAGAGTSNIYRYDGTDFDQITNNGANSVIKAVTADGVYYHLDGSGLYRLNPSAATANKRVTDATYTHTNSEYFVLNGALYFTAVYGGNNQTFKVEGDTIKRVMANLAMTGISVYDNVAYGLVDEGGFFNLYRFTGTIFERLNPDSIRLSEDSLPTPKILATASGVYFVRDPNTSGGSANEVFRYQSRRFERLFSLENIAANTSTNRFFEYNDEIYFTAYTASQGNLFKLELQ